MTAPLLEIRDLSVEFDTRAGRLRAIDGVSLALQPGKRLGIVGESGSGKSVLSRTAMGLLSRRDAHIDGTVMIDGQSVLDLSPRGRRDLWGRTVAMVFQDPMSSLHPITPVGEQIAEAVRRDRSVSRADAKKRAVELLDLVGIPQAERRSRARADEFSGGMRQRVMIAIAIAGSPKLLFADEPTTALDVTVQARILDLFDQLCREMSIGVVMVSHDLGVIANHTDEIAVMYAGKIYEQGPVRGVLEHPTMRYTQALMAAVPRLVDGRQSLPTPIPGLPPNLLEPQVGCRFAPRCSYAQDDCFGGAPMLSDTASGPDHRAACWHPAEPVLEGAAR